MLADGGASVRTVSILDADGRLTQLVDDRGGTTLYTYDTLDRQVEMTFHDGSRRTTTYNAASDVTDYVDENGSAFAYTYDAIGRTASVAVTRADEVVGTTAQSFQYDGLSRQTFGRDTIDATHADSRFAFDSLGRVAEEKQTYGGNDRYVTYNTFESLPPSRFTFPNAREVGYNYDSLYRRTGIEDDPDGTPADVAQWWFYGPARVAELKLGSGLYCTQMNNARTNSAIQSPTPQNPVRHGGSSIPNGGSSTWGTRSLDRSGLRPGFAA